MCVCVCVCVCVILTDCPHGLPGSIVPRAQAGFGPTNNLVAQPTRVQEKRRQVTLVPGNFRVSGVRVPAEPAAHTEFAREKSRHGVTVVAVLEACGCSEQGE